MKFLKYFFQSLIIYIFFLIIKVMGIKLSRWFFSKLFIVLGPKIRSNKIIFSNLEKINPNLSKNEKEENLRKMWKNYAITFIEYIFLKKFRQNNYHINIKNKKILENLVNSKEKVVFISGHFANFELMAMEITKIGVSLSAIYRPLNNYFLNFFMERLRKKYICPNQIKKGISGVKQAVSDLKKGNSLALMIDQRLSEGENINFFNSNSMTTTLPAQIALKYKVKIIPIHLVRKDDFSYEMEVGQPLDFKTYDNNNDNKIKISQKLNLWLEGKIKEQPDQWILTHNRWK